MIRFASGEKQLKRRTHETKRERRKGQFDSREEKKIFLSGEGWQRCLHSITPSQLVQQVIVQQSHQKNLDILMCFHQHNELNVILYLSVPFLVND